MVAAWVRARATRLIHSVAASSGSTPARRAGLCDSGGDGDGDGFENIAQLPDQGLGFGHVHLGQQQRDGVAVVAERHRLVLRQGAQGAHQLGDGGFGLRLGDQRGDLQQRERAGRLSPAAMAVQFGDHRIE